MTPYFQTAAITLYQGNAIDVLRRLPDESVHMCITSPPYYGLRDYGTAEWVGGDAECDHKQAGTKTGSASTLRNDGRAHTGPYEGERALTVGYPYRDVCSKCGAQRVDAQLGLEPTLDAYLDRLCGVFDEVRRVLRSDGTCWVNISDSYAGGGGYYPDAPSNLAGSLSARGNANGERNIKGRIKAVNGIKPKDLMLVPHRFALAMQARGWWVRSDIIWSKPNPMPESVTDRPTRSHEYVWLFSKAARYWYDADAVREAAEYGRRDWSDTDGVYRRTRTGSATDVRKDGQVASVTGGDASAGRNKRSVWTITPQPTPMAHFATYPEELVETCIKAGTSEHGVCAACGAPWGRIVERESNWQERKANGAWAGNVGVAENYQNNVHGFGMSHDLGGGPVMFKGWQPSCTCDAGAPIPATVLDPFIGSGTTAKVAQRLGRRSIGIDLSASYLDMAIERCAQQALWFSEATP